MFPNEISSSSNTNIYLDINNNYILPFMVSNHLFFVIVTTSSCYIINTLTHIDYYSYVENKIKEIFENNNINHTILNIKISIKTNDVISSYLLCYLIYKLITNDEENINNYFDNVNNVFNCDEFKNQFIPQFLLTCHENNVLNDNFYNTN